MNDDLLHIRRQRGYILCVQYDNDPPMPIYHGPRIDPRYAHPFFPGTVLPYVDAADWSHGRPRPLTDQRS